MKKQLKVSAALLSSILILTACQPGKITKSGLIGGEKDKHGCLIAAGYTWSEVRRDCVRLFEDGIRMNSAPEPDATSSSFAVFATDSSRVEFFQPHGKAQLLNKKGECWKNKAFELKKNKEGKWILTDRKQNTILFSE